MVPGVSGLAWRQTWSFTCIRASSSLVRALGKVDVLERQGLLVEDGRAAVAAPLPRRDVGELLVVAEGLALGGLALLPEVAAAGLLAGEGVTDHELAQLEEVGHPPGLLEALVHGPVAEDADVLPELLPQGGDLRQGLLEPRLVAGHAAVVPHDLAELAVVVVDRTGAADREEALHPVVDLG